MRSIILAAATGHIFPLMLLFSGFLLWRGHDEPGGGFVGGLVATAAFALVAIAFGVAKARSTLGVDPLWLIASGLAVVLATAGLPLLVGKAFLTGLWLEIRLPGAEPLALGTPLIFDIGVYAIVVGTSLKIIFALAEED